MVHMRIKQERTKDKGETLHVLLKGTQLCRVTCSSKKENRGTHRKRNRGRITEYSLWCLGGWE